jgi:tetratricopeptide (TPR) repeat protein
MRIALVLEPPAHPQPASAWLAELNEANPVSLLLLPTDDPLVAALRRALAEQAPNEAGVVVLARAAAGTIDDATWDGLGLGQRTRKLETTEDDAVETAIAEASDYYDRGDLERARRAYAVADALLARDNGPRRAEVLVCLAKLERERGASSEAATLLDRALAIFPEHRAALSQRIELAHASSDAATAAALRRRMLRSAQSDDERATLLSSLADESLTATIEALEQALGLRPGDPRLLERLQAAMEAAGRWSEAVDAKVALSETIEKPRDRARSLAAAAGMCARRTNSVARSVALYEAAIADDPTTPGAFDAIEAVLIKNDDWGGVERAYSRQIERLSERGETEAQAALLDRLAKVRGDRLGDMPGAIAALENLVLTKPDDVEARARLAAALEQTEQLELALRCLASAAACAPTRPDTFRDLHRIAARLGDIDRGYCACAVLVHLGEADLDEQLVYQQYAPETTQRPRAPLDARGWAELWTGEHDHAVSHIVHAIAPAAIELRLEQLRAAHRVPELPKRDRQQADKTTLTAVRTAGWACSLLGIPVPEIYAKNEDLPSGVICWPLPEPTLLLGKSLLSGRSVPELAFATARELAAQRLTARLMTFYPSLPELRAVLLAAVSQVLPMSLARDALPLRDALKARLDPTRRAELERAVEALHDRDGRLDLNGWLRAVEIASCRAGLVVCGDITAAARMLAVDGRVVGKLSAADRIRDLIPFSVSESYGRLRRAIGVAAGTPATIPP